MRFALLAGLASLVSAVGATALTYRLEANEKACFYTNVEQSNAKVAFYFAVSPPSSSLSVFWQDKSVRNLQSVQSELLTLLCCALFRSNLVVPSMLTTLLPHRAARS